MSFKTKTTTKLFFDKYSYKIVVVTKDSYMFRYQNDDGKYGIKENGKRYSYNQKIMKYLDSLDDYEIRVESPLVSFYTNNKKDVDFIANIDTSAVKYISIPNANNNLQEGVIILPKINHEFKVTLGSTKQQYDAFVGWAEGNSKVSLTKRCKEDLLRNSSWGGVYFYITGEKNLLMAKMHLGSVINRIDRIVKS